MNLLGSRLLWRLLLDRGGAWLYPLNEALALRRGRASTRLPGAGADMQMLQWRRAHHNGHGEIRVVVEVAGLQLHLQRVVQEDNVVGVQRGAGRVHGHNNARLVHALGQAQGAIRDDLLAEGLRVEIAFDGLAREEDEVLLYGHLQGNNIVVRRLVVDLHGEGHLLQRRKAGGGQRQAGANGSRNTWPMAEVFDVLILDRQLKGERGLI